MQNKDGDIHDVEVFIPDSIIEILNKFDVLYLDLDVTMCGEDISALHENYDGTDSFFDSVFIKTKILNKLLQGEALKCRVKMKFEDNEFKIKILCLR